MKLPLHTARPNEFPLKDPWPPGYGFVRYATLDTLSPEDIVCKVSAMGFPEPYRVRYLPPSSDPYPVIKPFDEMEIPPLLYVGQITQAMHPAEYKVVYWCQIVGLRLRQRLALVNFQTRDDVSRERTTVLLKRVFPLASMTRSERELYFKRFGLAR